MAGKRKGKKERLAKAREARVRAAREYGGFGGVKGFALGRAWKDGKPDKSRGLAVVAFVERKKPPGSVPKGEALPAEVGGVPIDVVEMRKPRLADTSAVLLHYLHPTVVGGIAIAREGSLAYGTIGGIVLDAVGRAYALTAQHVVSGKRCHGDFAGQRIVQPDRTDYPVDRYLGQVPKKGVVRDEEVDAALVTLEGLPPRKWRAAVWDDSDPDDDPVKPPPADPPADVGVYKIGATTGRTDGILRFIDAPIGFECAEGDEIEMTGQMLVKPEGQDYFAKEGDSGALLLDAKDRAVGLLHGLVDVRTKPTEPWLVHGVATWIGTVLSKLKVRFP